MSISVGSVAVDVVPDTRKFATQLKGKLKGVSAEVAVTADTAGMREKIKESTKAAPIKVKVTPDSDAFSAKVKADAAALAKSVSVHIPLTADGERMRRDITAQVATINKLAKVEIPVDLTQAAALRNKMALELDILKVMAREANPTVNVDADTGKAEAKIDAVARNRKSKIDVSAAGTGLTAILALGPALIPITAAVGGLAAAFALPLAAAGGGLTLGAIVAGAAIKQTETQKKKIDQLAKSVAAAKQNLANVQASSAGSSALSATAAQQSGQTAISNALVALQGASTPAAKLAAERRLAQARASLANSLANTQARSSLQVAGAQRKVAEATAAYDAAVKGLTPGQARFLKTQQALKDSFKGLVASAGPAIFGPVIKGMDLLSKIMPSLKGPLTAVSAAVGTLLDDLGKAAAKPGFKNFMNAFGALAGRSIVSFGHIFGNFAKGLFGLMTAFGPLSTSFVGGLTGISKGFADWGTGVGKTKGFRDFLAYVRDVGPKVAATIGATFKALIRIGIALAPLGALALGTIKVLADTVNKIPVPVLTATAGAIVAIVVALKAAQIINAGSTALGRLSTAINGFRGADSQLSKTQTAIRGLAGAGGIGLLTTAATTSNKKLGILAAAGGGALLGFAVGGPVGAAIGGAAGALFGLAKQADKGHKAIKVSLPSWKDYATTLDGVAASATKATRAMALQRLEKSGLLDATRKLGLTDRQAVDAIQGDPKQRKRLSDLLRNTNILTPEQEAALRKETGAVGSSRLATLRQNVVIAANPKELHAARKALRAFMAEPANKRLSITGVEDAKAELRSLRKALRQTWGMTPNPKTAGPGGLGVLLNPEGAGARGAIINRPTVALIGENGPERLTPLDQTSGNEPLPAGGGASGAMFHIDKVVAQDVNDLLRQMQNRARLSGLSGRRP